MRVIRLTFVINLLQLLITKTARCFLPPNTECLGKQMSEGTSLESLENGDVSEVADAQRMQAILSDMNASGAEVESPTQQSMPPMQRAPPMQQPSYNMQARQPMPPMRMMDPMMEQQESYYAPPPSPQYIPIDEERVAKPTKKKNVWSSVLDGIRDPFVVAILIFVLMLPMLHTFVGKYATWAFAVGGQLSWFGLLALSLAGGIVFGLYQTGCRALGL